MHHVAVPDDSTGSVRKLFLQYEVLLNQHPLRNRSTLDRVTCRSLSFKMNGLLVHSHQYFVIVPVLMLMLMTVFVFMFMFVFMTVLMTVFVLVFVFMFVAVLFVPAAVIVGLFFGTGLLRLGLAHRH